MGQVCFFRLSLVVPKNPISKCTFNFEPTKDEDNENKITTLPLQGDGSECKSKEIITPVFFFYKIVRKHEITIVITTRRSQSF